MYLARLSRYWASKISGSRPWPFGLTWRHRSRDHWTPNRQFPTGDPLKSSLYLASLLRYSVKHLSKHIRIENALISIFVLGENLGLQQLPNLVLMLLPGHVVWALNSHNRSRDLVSAVFGLYRWKYITGVKKWGKVGETITGFWPQTKNFLLFWPPTSVQNLIKIE